MKHSKDVINFKTDLDTSTTIFYLNTEQATEQAIVNFCNTPKTTSEIMQFLGLKHREHFRAEILKPLLENKILELTIPNKPKSPYQKYKAIKT